MSKLVAVVFPSDEKVAEATRIVRDMPAEGGVKLYASAVVARDQDGKLSVRVIKKEGHEGAAVGALIGALAGLAAGPLAGTIGATGGAILGQSADLINQSADAAFVKRFSAQLAPGEAAVVAEVAEDGVTSYEALMELVGGVVRK